MKEELYKYLSIGLLALLFLVCFGSLITYFVVGQESINIAYAAQNNGTYWNNLITNPDGSTWDFNSTSNSSSETVIFNDGSFKYSLYGFGSVSNNVFTASGGNLTFRVSKVGSSVSMPSRNWYAVGYTVSQSGSVTYNWYIQNNPQTSQTLSTAFDFVSSGTTTSFTLSNNYAIFNFNIPDGVSLTINWLCLLPGTNVTSFPGYVPNSYSPNGYNQGFTDGVNSVGGGTITGVNDLTGLTWEVPSSVTEQLSVSSVDYTVTGYAVRFDGDNSYTYNFTTLQLTNDLTFNNLVSAIFYKATGFSRAANSGDLIYFTGGTDITNTDLIQWLEDNNTFKTYTEGYQDGYNQGVQIGYQNGFIDGQEQAQVSLSGIYNLVGSIKTLGNINSYTFNGSTYVAYSGETDSFIDSSSVTYYANYYDTQGDDGVLLGYCVDYLFRYSVKVRTIVYGTSARWNQVGFNIIAINTVDNSSFTLSRDDTSYYKEFGSLGADNSNGTYISCEFDFEFPSSDEYRLMFVPISHNVSDDTDNASMLVFEDTYFLAQGSGSMSYDDYNYLIRDAYIRGMNNGRTNGYDSGREVGYNVGYSKGVEDAGNYTFNGLLGAVFDAPITMFIGKYNSETGLREGGLLNFNLLGVNLGGFVIALLSLGLILFILRLFIRGL